MFLCYSTPRLVAALVHVAATKCRTHIPSLVWHALATCRCDKSVNKPIAGLPCVDRRPWEKGLGTSRLVWRVCDFVAGTCRCDKLPRVTGPLVIFLLIVWICRWTTVLPHRHEMRRLWHQWLMQSRGVLRMWWSSFSRMVSQDLRVTRSVQTCYTFLFMPSPD